MATNVVSAVESLAKASLKSGHKLHGSVLTPAQWAKEAGFSGSAASPLRKFMARDSNNGCGRNGRYGKQDAQGMLDLLGTAASFAEADTKAKQDAERKRVRRALDKNKVASVSGARTAKASTKGKTKGATAKASA